MEYKRLGKSGLQLSILSFGSWLTFGKQVGDTTADDLMTVAYDNGVNFFDNAEIYSRGQSEIVMGEILKKKNWRRDSYVVSSKVFFGLGGDNLRPTQKGLSRKHVVEACEQSLQRMQLDYLDLFFCHRPDKQTPVEETVWTMHNLIQQGKILYWGTSEWSAPEIMEAHTVARQYSLIGPTMEQPQYNMLERIKVEEEYHHLYTVLGLGTTVWSPLASGVLSGKYNEGFVKETRLGIEGLEWLKDRTLAQANLERARKLTAFSKELGVSMPVLAIAWCLKNEHVSSVIMGASKTSQLQENFKALDAREKLTPEVMNKIELILQNKPKRSDF
ncbi:potassium channel beta subunit family protein [Chryseolinea lacunae]|uniref:Aldo/keto reductase n=1 Tax=Chryseolinea lacunae TaxID=2801331 RepID=A0ABS1KJI0_9BACT|nr:aldo/keto reductase [Chryseolinea lacunae]MBL0739590.1 aldo/keto reductase [Chryseolinea lacunae]